MGGSAIVAISLHPVGREACTPLSQDGTMLIPLCQAAVKITFLLRKACNPFLNKQEALFTVCSLLNLSLADYE